MQQTSVKSPFLSVLLGLCITALSSIGSPLLASPAEPGETTEGATTEALNLDKLKQLALSKRPTLTNPGLDCGSIKNPVGPYDYRTAKAMEREHGRFQAGAPPELDFLINVEKHHWSKQIEQLKRGVSTTVPGDLNYLLRAFPNHVPGLWAIARYNMANGPVRPDGSWPWSTECYLDRAIRLAPDDGIPWMIWGVVNAKGKKHKKALDAYLMARTLGIKSAELEFNIGLAYVALKQPEKAVPYAKRAYEMGYPLPGLKHKLKRMGVW